MQDPDHWYQEKADELAHWEIEILDHMKARFESSSRLDRAIQRGSAAASPLGRWSSGFPKQIEEVVRSVWESALQFDGLVGEPVVRFSPENPWPKRFDEALRIAQALRVKVDIR